MALTPGALATGSNIGITIPGIFGGSSTTTTTVPSTTTTTTAPRPTTTTSTTVATTTTTVATTTTTTTVAPSAGGLISGVDTYSTTESSASSNANRVVSTLGRTPGVLSDFFDWYDANGNHEAFPANYVHTVVSLGATPMVAWRPDIPGSDVQSVLTSITNGSEDSYIQSWAESAMAVNHPIFVRLMHEMNGDWYPWGMVTAFQTPLPDGTGYYPYSNTPAMYVAAFQHVVSIFNTVGASNVRFVWNPDAIDISQLSALYPGDAYVQWAAIDGYNRSTTKPVTFAGKFGAAYKSIVGITARPIMVAEMATVEYSGLSTNPSSKAQWISETYGTTIPRSFPHIKAVTWFDARGRNGETFQFDSSSGTLSAFQQALGASDYQARAS